VALQLHDREYELRRMNANRRGQGVVRLRPIADVTGIYLPVREMLLVSRISEISEKTIVCECDLRDHWVFDVHFPDDPIFPGSLIIEAAGQTVATWMWERGMRGRPRLVRVESQFKHPVTTASPVLTLHAEMRRRQHVCVGSVTASADGVPVATVDVTLAVVQPVS
jgi:3-hydroxymyristoyl/3-hydroxydecanoyl-(acyl carrier protein) dehydratase